MTSAHIAHQLVVLTVTLNFELSVIGFNFRAIRVYCIGHDKVRQSHIFYMCEASDIRYVRRPRERCISRGHSRRLACYRMREGFSVHVLLSLRVRNEEGSTIVVYYTESIGAQLRLVRLGTPMSDR